MCLKKIDSSTIRKNITIFFRITPKFVKTEIKTLCEIWGPKTVWANLVYNINFHEDGYVIEETYLMIFYGFNYTEYTRNFKIFEL